MTSPWKQPIGSWTQDYFETQILASASEEHSRVELKGSEWLDPAEKNADDLRNLLAQNLSAFSNYEGGLLVFGALDEKRARGVPSIDGGAQKVYKGSQTCKEWLQHVIPSLLDSPLRDFDVHAFGPEHGWDKVNDGRTVIVVEVRESDGAPHQNRRDGKYYGRFGSSNRWLSHQQIEDIRARLSHPKIHCKPSIPPEPHAQDSVTLRFEFTNVGRRKATHVSVLIFIPELLQGRRAGSRLYSAPGRPLFLDGDTARYAGPWTPSTGFELRFGEGTDFPILPTCTRVAAVTLMTPRQDLLPHPAVRFRTLPIAWEVYADDAPPTKGQTTMEELVRHFVAQTAGQ